MFIFSYTKPHLQGPAGGWVKENDEKPRGIGSGAVLEKMDVFTKFHDEDKVSQSKSVRGLMRMRRLVESMDQPIPPSSFHVGVQLD